MRAEPSKYLIKKDKKDFQQLYEDYYSSLVLFAQGILYDEEEAKDIVQEVFLDLWNKAEDTIVETTLKTFLFSCVKYKALNRIKKLKIVDKNQEQMREAFLFSYELEALPEEDLLKIQKILDGFPPQMQKVVTLHAFEGLKYYEIAETMNISINSVKTHLKRAYQKFRKELFNENALIICALSLLKKFF